VHAELLTLAYLTPMVGAKEAGQCRRNIMTKPQPRAHFYIIVIHHSIYYHVVWDSSKRRKLERIMSCDQIEIRISRQ
jgi:hypothetical protein